MSGLNTDVSDAFRSFRVTPLILMGSYKGSLAYVVWYCQHIARKKLESNALPH